MNRKMLIRRILMVAAAVVVALFIVMQVINVVGPKLRTETATHATVTDTMRLDGTILRKERLIENSNATVLSYNVESGTKLAKNGTIATIYDTPEAAAAESKRVELERQLKQLETLEQAAENASTNPETINRQIYQKLYQLQSESNDLNLVSVATTRDDLLNLMNQWQVVTGKTKTFRTRIAELKKEIASLGTVGKAKGVITAPVAGYFVEEIDGYETALDYTKATQLTAAQLKAEQTAKEPSSKTIGKICEEFDWYIACIVPAETALKLKENDLVTLRLPSASSERLQARVAAINREKDSEEAVLVLRCSYMEESLAGVRQETVLLDIGSYDGIRISPSAVHFETRTGEIVNDSGKKETVTKEVMGVYVTDGSELKFVEIRPLYTTEEFILCDPAPDVNTLLTDRTIALYDNVAIGGGELYDGKSIA